MSKSEVKLVDMDYRFYVDNVLKFDYEIFNDRFYKGNFNRNLAIAKAAVVDNTAVGFYLCKFDVGKKDRLLLHNIGVRRENQGMGIGRLMLRDVKREADNMKIRTIKLLVTSNNKVALHLYESEGFRNITKVQMVYEVGTEIEERKVITENNEYYCDICSEGCCLSHFTICDRCFKNMSDELWQARKRIEELEQKINTLENKEISNDNEVCGQ